MLSKRSVNKLPLSYNDPDLSQSQGFGAATGVSSINQIVKGVYEDIKNLRTTIENLGPFPKGQLPPPPLARFQNNINKIDK